MLAPTSSQTPPTSSRSVQQIFAELMAEFERAAADLEMLNVEHGACSNSEAIQERARARGMMPIHPARCCTVVEGQTASAALGPGRRLGLESGEPRDRRGSHV